MIPDVSQASVFSKIVEPEALWGVEPIVAIVLPLWGPRSASKYRVTVVELSKSRAVYQMHIEVVGNAGETGVVVITPGNRGPQSVGGAADVLTFGIGDVLPVTVGKKNVFVDRHRRIDDWRQRG